MKVSVEFNSTAEMRDFIREFSKSEKVCQPAQETEMPKTMAHVLMKESTGVAENIVTEGYVQDAQRLMLDKLTKKPFSAHSMCDYAFRKLRKKHKELGDRRANEAIKIAYGRVKKLPDIKVVYDKHRNRKLSLEQKFTPGITKEQAVEEIDAEREVLQ